MDERLRGPVREVWERGRGETAEGLKAGAKELTRREMQVLERIAMGDTNRQAGAAIYLSEETVKHHVKHILQKLRASNRSHAVAIAFRRGLLR